MHARFVTSVVGGLAGGLVVVGSQAFTPHTAGWLTFAIAIGLVVGAGVPALFRDRGVVGLGVDSLVALLGVWTIIASVVFNGEALRWLSFAEGAGFVALAVAGLAVNQVRLARLAHRAQPVQVPAATPEATRPAAVAA